MGSDRRKRGSASDRIGQGIAERADWRAERLADIRRIIREADPEAVEERKWRKPSNPAGVPVWSHDGIICVFDFLKNRVRLTFPKGASLKDPKGLFNARLESRSFRALDILEEDPVDEGALQGLIRGAAALNSSVSNRRSAARDR